VRQFMAMNENRRSSILFHLLVPGGKLHTVIASPSWSASFCSSTFHKRTREPLEPAPCVRIARAAHLRPPASDGVDRESSSVVIDADAHPSGVVGDVIDAVRNRPPEFGNDEVVHAHIFGKIFLAPFPSRVLEVADELLRALASVPACGIPVIAMATPVDPTLTAIERDRIAYVAFAASLNGTDGRKAAQEEGREVTQTDEDAYETASGVKEDAVSEPKDDGVRRLS
jgi:hypothetical protein